MLNTQDNLHTLIDSFTNPVKPVTLCSLSVVAGHPKFISAMDVGYAVSSSPGTPIDGDSQIQRMSLIDKRPVIVATVRGDVLDVAWSPDCASVAYIAYTGSADGSTRNQLWLKVGGATPVALTPLIQLFGRDGSPDDQTIVRFSRDGKFLLMVDTFGASRPSPEAGAAAPHASLQARMRC